VGAAGVQNAQCHSSGSGAPAATSSPAFSAASTRRPCSTDSADVDTDVLG